MNTKFFFFHGCQVVFSHFLFPLLILCCSFANAAAQATVNGYIKEENTGAAIEGAIITLLPKDEKNLLAYTTTNEKGYFSIQLNFDGRDFLLKVSMLGYQTRSLELENKNTQQVNLSLREEISNLKEVLIKPPRIIQYNDTISYNVSSFASDQDRSIADVLKKMPGIDVQADGTILYNGKAINKFYIEGLDLLDSKYSLAANNISFKDVSSVEVLEGHQPIKALRSTTFTDKAALNLKLKNSAKGKWLGTLELGAGLPFPLWKANLMAMKIAGASQSLNLFKSNNTGQNISTELKSHTLEDLINGQDNNAEQSNLIQLSESAPPVNEDRILFNRSYLGTINTVRKLKHDYQLRTNISYINDQLKSNNQSETAYYLTDNNFVRIQENNNTIIQRNRAEGSAELNKNTENFYLKDKFRAQLFWERSAISNTGTSPNNQIGKTPYHLIENDLNWLKTLGKSTLKFNSFNQYNYLPQELVVSPDDETMPFTQFARTSTLFSHTNISYSRGFRGWVIDYQAGIKATIQNLNTEIQHLPMSYPVKDSLRNELQWQLSDYYIKPTIRYNAKKINLSLTLPINLYNSKINNRLTEHAEKENYLYFNPEFLLFYKFNPLWTANFKASLSNDPGNADRLNQGFIFRSYRYLELGNRTPLIQRRQSYSAGLSYRNPVKSLFVNLSGIYAPTLLNQLSQRSFSGFISVGEIILQNNQKSFWRLSGRLSKGIDDWKATAAISVSYTSTEGELIQQNKLLNNKTNTLQITPSFNAEVSSWCNFSYTGDFSRNSLFVSSAPTALILDRINQRLGIGLIINKKLNVKAGTDYFYNQVSVNKSVSLIFADIGLRYMPGKNIEINLDCTNLFNKKNYAYTLYDGAGYTSNIAMIRPANVMAGVYFRW
ncbi:carboxypeptidase-like regulatory domain-containing protein [Pedobacter cryoconitis]|uniref:Carboxypeptidase-like protein n=1 Tax=Pedobacter cryoconitis TaxID=188932 RepID=A0A327SVC2_9SPHI|nr:carboxypeptidase-like regulatory domain-containing protein [Pedobacter cryoconitis]RAJ29567.1 carboxypeptidase-like protein [Pedobacter cryoconitis]